MQTRSDLAFPERKVLKKQYEKRRGWRPQAWPENTEGQRHTTAPEALRLWNWRGGRARLRDSCLHLGGGPKKHPEINLQNYRAQKVLRDTPWCGCTFSHFSFPQPQSLLEVSSGLDHASWAGSSSFLCPNCLVQDSHLLLLARHLHQREGKNTQLDQSAEMEDISLQPNAVWRW